MRRRWVFDKGTLIEITDGRTVESPRSAMVMPDIQPYKSMLTGELVNSRSRHRELLRQHGCVEVGNDSSLYHAPRPLQSPPGLKQTIIEAAHRCLKHS